VTGAGSGVGQGIIKALDSQESSVKLIVADISMMNAGMHWGHEYVCIPKLEEVGAIEKFIDIVRLHEADIIFPGSEFDVLPLARSSGLIEKETGARIVVAPEETVLIADDKWLTSQHFLHHGISGPETVLFKGMDSLEAMIERVGFPLVIKPRTGTSSRDVSVVYSLIEAKHRLERTEAPVIQEYLVGQTAGLSSEYTCSFFRSPAGELVGPFCASRVLRGGTSWIVEVAPYPEIVPYLLSIAQSVDFLGSLNIQLIVTARGPLAFELNCRFSGTTGIRAHFGFNEPMMSIESFVYAMELEKPQIKRGTVLRYVADTFLDLPDSGRTSDE